MSRRAVVALCAVALLGAACATTPEAEFEGGGAESTFTPFVVENLDDVGAGNAVAVDSQGLPFISAWGFPAELEEGEIPVSRPIGSANLPAVVLDTVDTDGIWTRGAAAMAADAPAGVTVPFGPATVKNLKDATVENTNGTDVTLDASGVPHLVWAAPDGIWYAEGGESFTVETVEKLDPPLDEAGALGRPSVAVDDDGVPWVAWSEDVGSGIEVRVASRSGERWVVQTIEIIRPCRGCPAPGPQPSAATDVEVTSDGPLVMVVDPGSTQLHAVQGGAIGGEWVAETVTDGVEPVGLDMTVDADGDPWASFYGGDGVIATDRENGGWGVEAVASTPEPPASTGSAADTIGIGVDDEGRAVVAWYDADADAVSVAASDEDGNFQPVETPGTEGGRYPSVAVAADGAHAYVAFQDQESQDLMLGTLGTIEELLVAQPSPTLQVEQGAGGSTGSEECGEDAEIQLDIVAQGTAYDPTCLVAPAGEPFTIEFDNQDAGIQHNVEIGADDTFADFLFQGKVITGVDQISYDADALDEGIYPFRCQIHPTTMLGTIAVVQAKGGK